MMHATSKCTDRLILQGLKTRLNKAVIGGLFNFGKYSRVSENYRTRLGWANNLGNCEGFGHEQCTPYSVDLDHIPKCGM